LQDDLRRFVSEPQPPPQGIEIPKEGKAKAKERREVGEGDGTVIVEDTSEEDDDKETLQDRFQLRSRFMLGKLVFESITLVRPRQPLSVCVRFRSRGEAFAVRALIKR
jgi:hypothetical protein